MDTVQHRGKTSKLDRNYVERKWTAIKNLNLV